jgi:large subunit ribosomal protein L5
MSENPMREIRMEKLTLNIGAGEAGPKLEKGKALLKKLSDSTVVVTRTHKRTTFGPAKGRPIGAKVTLRGEKAAELLAKLFQAVDNRIRPGYFDRNGNLSFGVKEYIHIPGMKYDPDIGIMGFDVAITLIRPGYRVSRKRIRPGRIGKSHRITPEEAQKWIAERFKVKITDEAEREYY